MKIKSKQIEVVGHILFWLSGYLVLILVAKTLGPFKKVDGTLLMPATVGTIINLALFYITSILLIPRFSDKGRTAEFILLVAGLLCILTIFETGTDYLFFTSYYSDARESFGAQIILNLILNTIILSLALGYGFTRNWIRNEKQRQSLKQEKLYAELNYLKTQLNPHFLFNVLNMAYSSAARKGDEQTADIIEKLSGLMRYMLYESNVEKIELEKEVDYIRSFINLQKMRFSDEMPVKVDFEIRGDYSSCRIAPLILIQFIENAFKYGVKLGKESEISILLNVEKDKIEFSIKNPVFLQNENQDRKDSGIGIKNVKKRLELIYPGKYELSINDSGSWYSVNLLINPV